GGWQGYTLVQRFETGVLSRSGNLVSLILRASPAGLSIDRIYISQADGTAGMDAYDSVNPVVIRHTSAPLIIPPSSDPNESTRFPLPAVSYALDHTKPLLIAVDFSATPFSDIMYKEASPREAVAYYKVQPPPTPTGEPEARKTNRTGYTRYPADATK